MKITEWPDSAKNPIGKVVDILGKSGENTTEMHAILAEYGLPYSYPKEVEKEADKIDPGITPEEIGRREDMRAVTTFTIDPRDAKDFDDALSIRKTEDGFWEVGLPGPTSWLPPTLKGLKESVSKTRYFSPSIVSVLSLF